MERQSKERLAFLGYQLLFWIIVLLPWRFVWPESLEDALFPPPTEAPAGNPWIPIIAHLGLFLPMGVLLRRGSHWLFPILLLSLLSETLQIFVKRHPSLEDIGVDLLGAGLGYFLAPQLLQLWDFATRKIPMGIALLALTSSLVFLLPKQESGWQNWTPEFKLYIANERTLDRPWTGTIEHIRIWSDKQSAPLADLDFRGELPKGVKREHGPPPRLDESGMTIVTNSLYSYPLQVEPLVQDERFTAEVLFTPDRTEEVSLARLLTLSRSVSDCNFTIGQHFESAFARLRNEISGNDGYWPELHLPEVLEEGKTSRLLVKADRESLSLEVKGEQRVSTGYSLLYSLIGEVLSQNPSWSLLSALWVLWATLLVWIYFFLLDERLNWAIAAAVGTLLMLFTMS